MFAQRAIGCRLLPMWRPAGCVRARWQPPTAVYVRVRAIACQAALGRRDGGRGFPRCGAQETAASGRYRSRDLCLTSMNALVAAELDAEINV